MTPSFILDENIVILAQRGQDEHGNTNPECADLVQQIIKICHTIVVDDVLWKKYVAQLNRRSHYHSEVGPFLMQLLGNALKIPGKFCGFGYTASSFDDEALIPHGSQDDVYLVRLAVETRAILVTTDGPLRDDLASCGIQSKYGLTVVSPKDALGLL